MKKNYFLVIILFASMAMNALAQDFKAETAEGYLLHYVIGEGEAQICGLDETTPFGEADLIIPSEVIDPRDSTTYNVTIIRSAAFKGKTGLTGNVVIPGSVREIWDNAFRSCGITGTLTLNEGTKDVGDCSFYENNFTGSLVIPNSVTRIVGWGFSCAGFTDKLVLGSGLAERAAGNTAFENGGFTAVYSHMPEPFALTDFSCFVGMDLSTIPLYVPKGAVETYLSMDVWKTFKSIEEMTGTGLASQTTTVPFVQRDNVLVFDHEQSIQVYNITGKMIYDGIASQVELPSAQGIYLVRAAQSTFKVMP